MSDCVNMESFKETDIGPIPVEWEATTIEKLVDGGVLGLQSGFPCGNHNQEGRGIPHLRPFNVDDNGNVSLDMVKYIETDRDNLGRYLLASGDVLFNNTNSEELVGKTAYWDSPGDYVLSNHMTIIRVLDDKVVDSFYLSRYLHKRWYDGFYRGICRRHVNQASISLARLKGVPIALPPLSEQRRIAHVLGAIQQAIAAQDDLIAAAREVKRSLTQRLFTYGPGSEPATTKETEIGEIPEHWEMVRVGEVFEIKLGKMLSKAARRGISPHPYLRNANVQWGYVDLSDVSEMDFTPDEMAVFRLKRDDILVCEGGEIGRTAIWEEQIQECYYQKALHRLRPVESSVLPKYFLYYMMLIFLIRQVPIVEGAKSTIAHLPVAKLEVMPFALPPVDEQVQLVEQIDTATCKITAEEQRKAALQALFKTMLHQLMTGQIRLGDGWDSPKERF
jgi:type I restriction enzyme S subunit